jgi:hypothetical protein
LGAAGVADRDLQAHVNPQAWLTNVLTKLVNNWPNSRLDDLMPWAWSARQTRQSVKPKAKGV